MCEGVGRGVIWESKQPKIPKKFENTAELVILCKSLISKQCKSTKIKMVYHWQK